LSRSEAARVALVVLLALPAGACVDYLNHRDSVTLAAGDAVHANAAIQTIDPWPGASREKQILYDGQYAKPRIDAYTTPPAAAATCNGICVTTNNISGGGAAAAGQ